jgi:phytoene dehydrogenase-like protein
MNRSASDISWNFDNEMPNKDAHSDEDITGGANTLRRRLYATPAREPFLCSASTPPGGGVHGMCGYHTAMQALASTSSSISI